MPLLLDAVLPALLGFSGKVLQAYNARDEMQVAVKVLTKSLDKNEIGMLGRLKHENIVKVRAWAQACERPRH